MLKLNKGKTDNSHFAEKIDLRLAFMPGKESIRVLDLFGGYGKIWDSVRAITGKNIDVDRIEKKDECGVSNMIGDNMKYLPVLDINKYDIIDIDAYGIPFEQIDNILGRKYNGEIFITYIQTMNGGLPKKMLRKLGYTNEMIRKHSAIFNKNGIDKLKNVLSLYGICSIFYVKRGRKIYARIKLNPE